MGEDEAQRELLYKHSIEEAAELLPQSARGRRGLPEISQSTLPARAGQGRAHRITGCQRLERTQGDHPVRVPCVSRSTQSGTDQRNNPGRP